MAAVIDCNFHVSIAPRVTWTGHNMPEYVYILTNPRMTGLIKIGKTTKSPQQRMKELHSTGVPEPFELECAFIVDNCAAREKNVHRILNKYRLSGREFFEIGVESALLKILPVLGDYEIYHASRSYNIPELEDKLLRKADALRIKDEKLREQRKKRAKERDDKFRAQQEIENRLNEERASVYKWHREAVAKLLPDRPLWLYMMPISFLCLWLIPEFFRKTTDLGVLMLTAIISYIVGNIAKGIDNDRRNNSPSMRILKYELEEKLKAVREIINACPNCGQSLRFDRAKLLDSNTEFEWKCPRCKSEILPRSFL